jgi:hypothetical protein
MVVILYVGVWLVVAGMRMPHRDAPARHRTRIQQQQLRRTESAEYSGPLTLGLAGQLHDELRYLCRVTATMASNLI